MYIYQRRVQKNKNSSWKIIIFTLIFSVASSYVFSRLYKPQKETSYETKRLSSNVENTPLVMRTDTSKPDIVEAMMNSVVGISTIMANEESIFDIELTDKWKIGTGIIVSENGYIITNQHLAQKSGKSVTVNLQNGENIQGKIVWTQEDIDLAILKIEKKNLTPAKLGDSDIIRVGESVLAIGNPLGVELMRTTTGGIISGKNRSITFNENNKTIFMEDLIQTDASINSGNSGGPLINSEGEVIGINTVKINSAEGIGFAIPINLVKPIIEKFEENGNFNEAYLGVFAYDAEIIKYTKSNIDLDEGLYVTNVTKLGPAEKAGIRKGDILLSIDGVKLNKITDLRKYIYSKNKKDVVTIIISRNNKMIEAKVTLM